MALKIHHLNCATLCPTSKKLINGHGGLIAKAKMICHCLLIETNDGLVLVDTGFSYDDICNPSLMSKLEFKAFSAVTNPEESAIYQVQKLGFKREDVRHIIVTHLDRDHAGGIKDFPNAQVHIYDKELIAANDPKTLQEKVRYRNYHWQHNPQWVTHRYQGELWEGFESVQVLTDALYDILLIPLTGHSRGHAGVAVSTNEGWLLHCGDAYMHHQELQIDSPSCPLGVRAIHLMDDISTADRMYNQDRLRDLAKKQDSNITLFCSHDHTEFESLCGSKHHLGRPA